MMGIRFLIFIIFPLREMCIDGCVSSQRDPYMDILQKLGISQEISEEISPQSRVVKKFIPPNWMLNTLKIVKNSMYDGKLVFDFYHLPSPGNVNRL